MEYESESSSLATVLCCICGVKIAPNPLMRCLPCLQVHYNISEDIHKEVIIHFCKGCDRFLDPPSQWITAQLNSEALLRLCIKRTRGLDKVALLKADFEPTEPHSLRLIVAFKISKEIGSGTAIEQEFEVTYILTKEFCSDCHRIEAKDFWKAVVQVRQKVGHKKTFYYLEQLMLKHKTARFATNLKANSNGMDMFFVNEREARKVVEFISAAVVSEYGISKKLISHDIKSNVYNSKYSYSVDLAPICKDSLVCLSPKTARSLGSMARIAIVLRATNQITLLDPRTAAISEVNKMAYYKDPFIELVSCKQLKKFIVTRKEFIPVDYNPAVGQVSHKHVVSDMWVQRESEYGRGDEVFCRTHLGRFVDVGDTVMGYDLQVANINNEEFDKMKEDHIPDVILVKKFFGDKAYRNRMRKWRLQTMDRDDRNSQNKDYVDFLEDLEEDPQIRAGINVFKDPRDKGAPSQDDLDDHPDAPTISIEEMLEELAIDDGKHCPTEEVSIFDPPKVEEAEGMEE